MTSRHPARRLERRWYTTDLRAASGGRRVRGSDDDHALRRAVAVEGLHLLAEEQVLPAPPGHARHRLQAVRPARAVQVEETLRVQRPALAQEAESGRPRSGVERTQE